MEEKSKKQTIIIVASAIAVIALLIGATTAYFLARQTYKMELHQQ